MKKIFTLLIIMIGFAPSMIFAQKHLSFKDGKFRVVQFTDMHWNTNTTKSTETIATIKAVLNKKKPDLAILTGDIVGGDSALESWMFLVNLFENAKTPFAVTMGNHDPENINKDVLFDNLLKSPYFVGEKGPKNIMGVGNFTIPIYNSKKENKVEAVLYCLDSNDYPPVNKYGHYDWVHFSQIKWYRKQSLLFTQSNEGKPLPSLAFIHIPLIEYNNVIDRPTTMGNNLENGVSSPRINSGLFGSFIDMKDVMGVFAGHDHENDFIGMEYGIALAYGRVSGADAYGTLERGGRVIELYEGMPQFDTWISTPTGNEPVFYYPSALNSNEEETMEYFPAKNVNPTKQGVMYTYYEGKFKQTNQVTSGKKVKEGIIKNISIDNAQVEDHFGYDFRTLIKIPKKGVYSFYTFSDDGSRLYIDGQEVVNNDEGHSARRREGKIALDEGFHELRILYFEDYMGQELEVGFSSRYIMETTLPNDILFVPE